LKAKGFQVLTKKQFKEAV